MNSQNNEAVTEINNHNSSLSNLSDVENEEPLTSSLTKSRLVKSRVFDFMTLTEYFLKLKKDETTKDHFDSSLFNWDLHELAKQIMKEIELKKYSLKNLLLNTASLFQKIAKQFKLTKQQAKVIFAYVVYNKLVTIAKNKKEIENNETDDNDGPLLYSLEFPNYNIGYLGLEYLIYLMTVCSDFYSINLSNNNLNDDKNPTLKLFAESFMNIFPLSEINLSYNKIGDKTTNILFNSFIKANAPLIEINLSHNEISFESCDTMSSFLGSSNTVVNLNISYNIIGENGIAIIAEGLKKNTSLEIFDVSYCGIGSQGCKYLKTILSCQFSNIKELYLSGNCIQYEGYIHLSQALLSNISLELLDLSYNNDKKDNKNNLKSFTEFAKGIERNMSLKTLDLSGNICNEKGIQSLSSALASANHIQSLILHRCKLKSEGVMSLISNINLINSLKILDLSQNDFDKTSFQLFCNLFKHNSSIEQLNLSECSIGNFLGELSQVLTTNKSLHTLKLSGNNIRTKNFITVFKSLLVNKTLLQIHLDNNLLDNEAANFLASSLSQGYYNVKYWNLNKNKITDEGGSIIQSMANVITKYTDITLEGNNIHQEIINGIKNALSKISKRNLYLE